MKKLLACLVITLAVGIAGSALAADFKFTGDLNNRFCLFTNQAQMFHSVDNVKDASPIDKDGINEFFADIKYRLQTEMATNDGGAKGVFAIEVGGLQFGDGSAADFSGDGIAVEVRFLYTDFAIPSAPSNRVSIGLQALTVNHFVWWETVPSVQLKGGDAVKYKVAWARGLEAYNTDHSDDSIVRDFDSFVLRLDLAPMEKTKVGVFGLYQHLDNADDTTVGGTVNEFKNISSGDMDIYTIGVDGSFGSGDFFLNWDLIYEGGTFNNKSSKDLDLSAFLAHADLGMKLGKGKITYTVWYASGDDDPTDGDIDNFMSTDVDFFDSIIFFEGGYSDDDYFTEAPYLLDKGLFLNKLAYDHKVDDKLKFGVSALYLMTAEDLEWAGHKDDKLGIELDGYVSYMIYPNCEFAVNAGYLIADDGMDYWENDKDGNSDSNPFRTTARVRYKF